jgi:hypothetical protein
VNICFGLLSKKLIGPYVFDNNLRFLRNEITGGSPVYGNWPNLLSTWWG